MSWLEAMAGDLRWLSIVGSLVADHGGPTTRPTSGPTTYPTSGPTSYPTSGPTTPTTYPTSGGRDVGHVGPDRRACRARSSGMSGTSGPTSGDRRVVGCQKLPFSASILNSATSAACQKYLVWSIEFFSCVLRHLDLLENGKSRENFFACQLPFNFNNEWWICPSCITFLSILALIMYMSTIAAFLICT